LLVRGSPDVVVDCSVWLLMKLDKADVGLVLPMEFYQYRPQDQQQEDQGPFHHCHADFGTGSESDMRYPYQACTESRKRALSP
jgi:hypothetical protein